MKTGSEGDGFQGIKAAALLSGIGLTLAIAVGIGVGLGYLADQWWKTNGVAVIVGAIVGIIAGFKQMLRIVQDAMRLEEAAERRRREERKE
ncbi:MAG: AtpZ/AtpI family protein [Armatimonadetes bacterium]|nr:AtpZ/AtpI family protein [Armatimonadota bacterium]